MPGITAQFRENLKEMWIWARAPLKKYQNLKKQTGRSRDQKICQDLKISWTREMCWGPISGIFAEAPNRQPPLPPHQLEIIKSIWIEPFAGSSHTNLINHRHYQQAGAITIALFSSYHQKSKWSSLYIHIYIYIHLFFCGCYFVTSAVWQQK